MKGLLQITVDTQSAYASAACQTADASGDGDHTTDVSDNA